MVPLIVSNFIPNAQHYRHDSYQIPADRPLTVLHDRTYIESSHNVGDLGQEQRSRVWDQRGIGETATIEMDGGDGPNGHRDGIGVLEFIDKEWCKGNGHGIGHRETVNEQNVMTSVIARGPLLSIRGTK